MPDMACFIRLTCPCPARNRWPDFCCADDGVDRAGGNRPCPRHHGRRFLRFPPPATAAHDAAGHAAARLSLLWPRLRLSGGGSGSIPRERVSAPVAQAPGTIFISTSERRLYLILGNGEALRYGIGVGRDGFRWTGNHHISAKKEWPSWTPPRRCAARRPDLPRYMAGGIENPLGARAMYLGSTLYRIHGSNEPETIGHAVSSGCFPHDQRRRRGSLQSRLGRHTGGGQVDVRFRHSGMRRRDKVAKLFCAENAGPK